MAKRNKLEIIKDILKIIQNNHSIKPTPLLRRSNVSSSRFKEYYLELLEKEFIKETSGKNKQITLTKKGYRYLEKYSAIINFIDEFEL
ncbi:MAG: winged helix-turn-helix transcriptional regulator [Nanoarchaeota archaeon]|nr:winged helix-turn-helix transcriptional regulator [Nanoarchaeota archaeon]MBU1051532.1 winged helix-turn-helix transcriptional regulator [Nanoarchaeota archaeon]